MGCSVPPHSAGSIVNCEHRKQIYPCSGDVKYDHPLFPCVIVMLAEVLYCTPFLAQWSNFWNWCFHGNYSRSQHHTGRISPPPQCQHFMPSVLLTAMLRAINIAVIFEDWVRDARSPWMNFGGCGPFYICLLQPREKWRRRILISFAMPERHYKASNCGLLKPFCRHPVELVQWELWHLWHYQIKPGYMGGFYL